LYKTSSVVLISWAPSSKKYSSPLRARKVFIHSIATSFPRNLRVWGETIFDEGSKVSEEKNIPVKYHRFVSKVAR
jgi:hypothetical protein